MPDREDVKLARVAESGSIVIGNLGFGVSGNPQIIVSHINAAVSRLLAEESEAVPEDKFVWSSEMRIAWRKWEDGRCRHDSHPMTSCLDCLEEAHSRAVKDAVERERERCAKIVEDMDIMPATNNALAAIEMAATDIRSQGA